MFPSNKIKKLKPDTMSLGHRLISYMLIMFIVVLVIVVLGSLAFGKFPVAQKQIKEDLDVQMLYFEKDVSTNMDRLTSNGLLFAKDLSTEIESSIQTHNAGYSDLINSQNNLIALENKLFDVLYDAMTQADCTGAFFILDSNPDNDNSNRPGIYVTNQNNIYDKHNPLLFRGDSSFSETKGINIHRKWKASFDVSQVPNYNETIAMSYDELKNFYSFSQPTVLTGTSEKVMILMIPILGSDGDFYGVCGLEISATYFKNYFAQPTTLEYLSCALSPFEENEIKTTSGFSAGILNGNYTPLYDDYKISSISDSMMKLHGKTTDLRGLIKPIKLSENSSEMVLTVAVTEDYYRSLVFRSTLTTILLLLILIIFAIICSIILSKKFLNPVSDALLLIKSKGPNAKKYNIKELDDLLDHISASEEEFNKQYSELISKQNESEQKLYEINEQLKILAQEKAEAISAANFELFKENIKRLTPKETEIFDLYTRGANTNEILAEMDFSKNALKYHNKNMYAKLGVSNKKELLQYIIMMNVSEKDSCNTQ